MLRRVAPALRVGLLCLGVLLAMCIPVSYFYWISVGVMGYAGLGVADGQAVSSHYRSKAPAGALYARVQPAQDLNPALEERSAFVPRIRSTQTTVMTEAGLGYPATRTDTLVPLWLLAFLCLAWPVTSLLLARRRRKGRGFAVEPAADAVPPAIDNIAP